MINTTQSAEPRSAAAVARGFASRGLRSAVFGLLLGAAIAVLNRQDLGRTLVHGVLIALACWACIDGGRLLAARLLHRLHRGASPYDNPEWPGWPIMIAIIVTGSAAGYTGGMVLGGWVYGYPVEYPLLTGDVRDRFATLLFSVLPAIAITYFLYTRRVLADRAAAAEAAQRQAAESRLRLLESQLEPHMLFNTLANLRALISIDPPRAQQMLDQLIGYLRATLSGSRLQWHPLSAEFARLDDYLALMRVRMGDRLEVRFDLPDALAGATVPPLLLQPLVENSIGHGLEPAIGGGRVEVRARSDGAELVLEVRDTGVGYDAAACRETSFGLAQVRERLATLYGAAASLSIGRAADGAGGTLATIRLPATRP